MGIDLFPEGDSLRRINGSGKLVHFPTTPKVEFLNPTGDLLETGASQMLEDEVLGGFKDLVLFINTISKLTTAVQRLNPLNKQNSH